MAVEHRDGRVIMVTVALTDRHRVCSCGGAEAPAVCAPPSLSVSASQTRCSAMIPCCHQQKSGFAVQRSSSLLSWFSCFTRFVYSPHPNSPDDVTALLPDAADSTEQTRLVGGGREKQKQPPHFSQ